MVNRVPSSKEISKDNKMEIYTKPMTEREFLFTLLASNFGIAPRVVGFRRDQGMYMVDIELYPYTLMDVPDWCRYKDQVHRLLQQLHDIGILHNDVTEENIVVNPQTGDVRLIDFGLSLWIDDIQDVNPNGEVADIYGRALTMQDPDEDIFEDVNQILLWEEDEIYRICR